MPVTHLMLKACTCTASHPLPGTKSSCSRVTMLESEASACPANRIYLSTSQTSLQDVMLLVHVHDSCHHRLVHTAMSASLTIAMPSRSPSQVANARCTSSTLYLDCRVPSSIPAIDDAEVAKFSRMASAWWDPRGPMAPLHSMNPIRVKFCRNVLSKHFRYSLINLDYSHTDRDVSLPARFCLLCCVLKHYPVNLYATQ